MKHKLLLRTFLLFFFLSLIGLNAQPTTVYVDDDFNSGTAGWGTTHFAKIQDGIDVVAPEGTVDVAAGTYTEDILINKPLTLNGANANIPYGIGRVSESILQPFTQGIAPISLGADQDHVTINGFEITGEMSENAIYCGVIGPSYLDIKFNYIHHIGTLRSTQNIYAINYRGGPNNSDDRTDVNVSDNYFDEILNHSVSTNNKGSSAAIWLGQSNGEGTVSNVTIERNVIKNVRSNLDTKSFEPDPYDDVHKITASGIYIGIGWKDIGNVSGAIIRDNSITNIIGGSAYGIQLSGNTPGLNVQNNIFDNVSSPVSPSYSYDVGITSTNQGSATISVTNNSFSTASYGVANSSDNTIDATGNWWGNATGPYNATTNSTGTGNSVSDNVDYSPWWGADYVDDAHETAWTWLTNDGIQDAIDKASPGDIVQVAAGTYPENITISKALTLLGANADTDFDSRVSESVISPLSGADKAIPVITVSSDGVILNGFEITGPSTLTAISSNQVSDLSIKYNNIHHMGTELSGDQGTYKSIRGVYYSVSTSATLVSTSNVSIVNNIFNDFGNTDITKNSTTAISFLQSNSTGILDGLTISNNTIENVFVSTGDWSSAGGRIAYGILINTGFSGGGKVVNAEISDNNINHLEGFIATGIGLEGSTENAIVNGNTISYLTAYKIADRSGGGYDLNGLKFEDNDFVNTCTVQNNVFATNTFTHNGVTNRGYAVANYVNEADGGIADVSCNWFGTSDPFEVADNPSYDGKIFNKDNCRTDFLPISTSADPINCDGEGPISIGGKTYLTIEDAINDASPGDVISFTPGSYNSFEVSADGVTLVGNGAVIGYSSPAIIVNANNVTITGFTFNYNASNYAIRIDGGSGIEINNCKFLTVYGVNNKSTNLVKAENNYWNDPSGPTIASNPSGTGAEIWEHPGLVDYAPWWADVAMTTYGGLISPINGLTGVSIMPTFEWAASFTSDGVNKLQISTVSDFSVNKTVIVLTNGTNSFTLSEDLKLENSTKYYWRLKHDGSFTDVWEFTTLPEVNVSFGHPTGGTVYTTSTMFTWSIGQATGSMKFKVQIVAKAGTTEPTELEWASATLTATTSSLYRTFTLNSGTHYFWRVVVLNSNDGVISYSTVVDFTTSGGASVTVTPSWPIGEALVYTNSPTLYWYLDQYAPDVKYKVFYVSKDNNATGTTTSGELDNASSTSLTSKLYVKLSNLDPGKKYYWQVQTEYDGTPGDYTDPESFVTNGSGTLLEPTPSYPVGDLEIYTVSPTFYWYLGGSSSGLTFNIEYRPQGNPGATVSETSSSLYKKITNLTPGLTYEWRVQSDNGTDQSDWSDWETFIISGGVTSTVPVASFPIGNPTMYTQNPTLRWYLDGSSLGIEGYIVKYSTADLSGSWTNNLGSPDATDGQFEITSVNKVYWKVSADLTYGQKYYWAVAAIDGSNNLSDFSSTESFTIAGGAGAGDVILSNPTGGDVINTTSPTLRWYFTGSTIGIVGYDVEYSDNGGLSSWTDVASALSSKMTYVALSNLSAGATYTWRVRAYYGGTTYGNWSDEETFVVDNGSSIVQPLVGGPNNVTINSSNATLSWINPSHSQDNLTYEVEISKSSNFSDSEVILSAKNYGDVSDLSTNSEYFWRVRAKSNDGEYSNYSSIGNFKTDDNVTAIENEKELPEEFSLVQNYPNPFNPTTTINYSLPQASYVTIKIYNMLGQEVNTLVNQDLRAGRHSVIWRGDDNYGNKIASGTYIYRITAGDFVQAKKMILLK